VIWFLAFALGLASGNTHVRVLDYSHEPWPAVVAETTADFAPLLALTYERRQGECPPMRHKSRRGHKRPVAIIVCSQPQLGHLGASTWQTRRIWLNDDASAGHDGLSRHRIACHEFVHIFSRQGDNYGSDPNSCMWGYLDEPGSTDIALILAQLRHDKKQRGKR